MVISVTNSRRTELINEKLERKVGDCKPKFKPREYQKELFLEALERNVIIYLGTGLGKTYISVLYLNDPRIDQLISSGKKAVFLAITQDLVKQQATYINQQVRFNVKIFCSRTSHCGKHIDHWNQNEWNKELEVVDILFLTPQVFLNAISTNLLRWEQFCVIFYDECHHGSSPKSGKSGTQYYRLTENFRNFYSRNPDKERPRVIGLTASLINNMPKNRANIVEIVKSLECNYQSTCKTDLGVQGEMPKMIMQTFEQPKLAAKDQIYNILENMIKLMNIKLEVNKVLKAEKKGSNMSEDDKRALSFVNRLKLASVGFSIKPTSFPKVLQGLQIVHDRCGLWAFATMCDRLSKAVKIHTMGGIIFKDDIKMMYELFKQILAILHQSVIEFLALDESYEYKFVRPKGFALLTILKSEYERAMQEAAGMGADNAKTFSCIVFVRSRLEVVALNAWLQRRSQRDPEYNFIKCDYAIGLASTMNSKFSCITKRKPSEQAGMLDNFRKGELNVIITTAVLEEGIDLPRCSSVIRYDEPGDFRQYVQSRGRARQLVSSFILMTEATDYNLLKSKMDKFNDFEQTVKEAFARSELGVNLAKNFGNANTSSDQPRISDDMMKEDTFCSDDMSLQINSSVAKTILHMYCARLSKGTPFAHNILYDRTEFKTQPPSYQTTLSLPSGCPCNEPIKGNIKRNEKLADMSAIIAAIKRLYELKEINEHAVPTRASQANIEKLLIDSNINIKCVELSREQLGFELSENDDKISYLFEPQYLKSGQNLMQNCQTANYKFVRVTFKPIVEQSRCEARYFFRNPAFGLILHNSVDPQVLPKTVYSHYGKLDVEYTLISDNFVLRKAQDHDHIMDYMYKLFASGLAISNLNRSLFKSKCLVYCVPLDPRSNFSNLDYQKMRGAFQLRDLQIANEDVVGIHKYYKSNNHYQPSDDFYLVKSTNSPFLTVNSRVPGKPYTFLEDIRHRFGPNIVSPNHLGQPIVEVMQISRALGQLKPCQSKKVRVDHESRSLFFMAQMLQKIDVDASSLIQLNALSVILYKAFQQTVANKLELSLAEAAKRRVVIARVVNPPMEVDLPALVQASVGAESDREEAPRANRPDYEASTMMDNSDNDDQATDNSSRDMLAANSNGSQDDSIRTDDVVSSDQTNDEDPTDTDCDLNDDDDGEQLDDHQIDDQSSDDDEDSDQDDDLTSNSSASILFNKQEELELYERMICKRQIDLQDDEDYHEKMKNWDMRQYKETNLREINIERRDYYNNRSDPRTYENSQNYRSSFHTLDQKLADPLSRLCQSLENFEFTATTNDWLLDQDKEFEKRRAIVDRSIRAELVFDQFNSPMAKDADHNFGLLEALTLRAAQETYSLELVETLGDSFLKYMVSVVLYRDLDAHEGFLTSARSQLVGNKYFEYLAKSKYLGSYAIRCGFSKEALANQFGRPIKDRGDLKSYCTKLRPKDLADMFEAIVGYHLATQGQFKALTAMEWLGLDIFKESLFETAPAEPDAADQSQPVIKFAKFPSALVPEANQDLFKASAAKLKYFVDIIGYQFNDISHLIQAFTHASYLQKCTKSYERLEFLGDAILDFLVTTTLYNSSQIKKTPGQLTQSRSALVNNYVFARLAIEYKFDLFVMYFDLEMYNQLARVRLALTQDPELKFLDMIDFDPVVKLLADLFEAVAGAIFIDSGGSLDQVWSVFYPMMYANLAKELQNPTRNPISLLYETFSGRDRVIFEMREERIHNQLQFKAECKILDYKTFEGSGDTRSQAKLRAVQKAIDNLPDEKQLAELNEKFKQSLPMSERNRGRGHGRASGGRGRGSINERGHGGARGSFNQGDRRAYGGNFSQHGQASGANNRQRFNSSNRDRQHQMDRNWRK